MLSEQFVNWSPRVVAEASNSASTSPRPWRLVRGVWGRWISADSALIASELKNPVNALSESTGFPQRLKPEVFGDAFGTTERRPFRFCPPDCANVGQTGHRAEARF